MVPLTYISVDFVREAGFTRRIEAVVRQEVRKPNGADAASPDPTSTATPTATPTPAVTPTPRIARIANTQGQGVRLRQSPEGPIIGALRQGDLVMILYGREILNGLVWVEVLDGEGRRGWLPEMFIAVILASPTARATS